MRVKIAIETLMLIPILMLSAMIVQKNHWSPPRDSKCDGQRHERDFPLNELNYSNTYMKKKKNNSHSNPNSKENNNKNKNMNKEETKSNDTFPPPTNKKSATKNGTRERTS